MVARRAHDHTPRHAWAHAPRKPVKRRAHRRCIADMRSERMLQFNVCTPWAPPQAHARAYVRRAIPHLLECLRDRHGGGRFYLIIRRGRRMEPSGAIGIATPIVRGRPWRGHWKALQQANTSLAKIRRCDANAPGVAYPILWAEG